MAPETPTASKTKTPKDKSEKKSSKKRRHEEQSQSQDTLIADDTTPTSKPSKKRRKSEKTEDTEDVPAIDALPGAVQSPPTTNTAGFSPSLLDSASPFVTTTSSLLLPLAPQAFSYPLPGLCAEHLSPLLLTYYPPLDGIVLSYASPRLSQSPSDPAYTSPDDAQPLVLARTADEYATPFIWLTAEFTLLRPRRGTYVSGTVRVQNPSWLGLVCWNYFNAGIPKARLPKDWTWTDPVEEGEEGYWSDGAGQRIGGSIVVRVRDFESAPSTERERGFVALEGTLLSEEEDKEVDKAEREAKKARKRV